MDRQLIGRPARLAAAAIALAAWLGIAIHVEAQMAATGSVADTLWILARYFTVLTNLVVAVVFTLLALGWSGIAKPRLLGGVALSIILVGVVYDLFLQGLQELTAGAAVANVLLHRATPIAVPVFWLLFVPKGQQRWIDPLLWAIYPVAYVAYAVGRGGLDGRYAYPFIDVVQLGAMQVTINVVVIALGFLVAGFALVWLDHRLASRTT